MTKLELKTLVQQLDTIGVPDSAEIKVEVAIDNSRMSLKGADFKIEGQDATYGIDAAGNWAANVNQANAVVLKQL